MSFSWRETWTLLGSAALAECNKAESKTLDKSKSCSVLIVNGTDNQSSELPLLLNLGSELSVSETGMQADALNLNKISGHHCHASI